MLFYLKYFYIFGQTNLNFQIILHLGIILFFIGLFGVLYNLKRIIVLFLCIELMWLGISLCFLGAYILFNNVIGLLFAIMILTVAAAEAAIGLSLLINFYRIHKNISLRYLTNLRG